MGTHRRISTILLISCFLLLFLSHEVKGATVERAAAASSVTQKKENVGKSSSRKMMVEVEDYKDPGPNNPGKHNNNNMAPSAPATP